MQLNVISMTQSSFTSKCLADWRMRVISMELLRSVHSNGSCEEVAITVRLSKEAMGIFPICCGNLKITVQPRVTLPCFGA